MIEAVQRRRYWIAALAAVVATLSRAFLWYRARPLWLDEEMILLNVRDRNLHELVGPLWLDQSAPIGWLGLERAILLEFGTADRTGRALPVLLGIGTVWLAFWFGRRWMGPLGAAVFVLLCSFGQLISFFTFETKPYSADVFASLLLLGIAAWALEPSDAGEGERVHRIAIWWLAAAIGLWFANGALFVTPACAVVICALIWRRFGWRPAVRVALPGLLWVASLSLNYAWSIRFTRESKFLQEYWSFALPPARAGLSVTIAWIAAQLKPLAANPAGTPMSIFFWLATSIGIALTLYRRVSLGLLLLAIPLSAAVLAALRLVPLSGRLSLWMLPALYVGIAIAADLSVQMSWSFVARRNWILLSLTSATALISLFLFINIFQLGRSYAFAQPVSNHGLDDGSAVRFLMSNSQPGDALMSTHHGLPAIWWYAGASLASPNLGRYARNGSPILALKWFGPGPACESRSLAVALAGKDRALVYLGFGSRIPDGFQELVLDRLSELGTVVAYREIAEEGLAAVFDLHVPPKAWTASLKDYASEARLHATRPSGCVIVEPAGRW